MKPHQTAAIITLYMLAAYTTGIMSMPIFLYGTLSSNIYVVLYGAIGMLVSTVFICASSELLKKMKKVKQ